MNIAAYAHKFFLFSGVLLIVIAVIQLLTWTRAALKNGVRNLLDANAIRILLFLAFGVFAILVGVGVIPLGGSR